MMYTLYDHRDSGNGYKIRVLRAQLQHPYHHVELDILRGATRTPQFLAKNPNGRIPTLEFEDGQCLAESNAILCYLAEGSAFLPSGRLAHAQVLQWMFFEQYSHEPNVATPRFILHHLAEDHPLRAELPQRQKRVRAALAVMEGHLARHRYFVGERYSISAITLYAYTHLAVGGGLARTPYPELRCRP